MWGRVKKLINVARWEVIWLWVFRPMLDDVRGFEVIIIRQVNLNTVWLKKLGSISCLCPHFVCLLRMWLRVLVCLFVCLFVCLLSCYFYLQSECAFCIGCLCLSAVIVSQGICTRNVIHSDKRGRIIHYTSLILLNNQVNFATLLFRPSPSPVNSPCTRPFSQN